MLVSLLCLLQVLFALTSVVQSIEKQLITLLVARRLGHSQVTNRRERLSHASYRISHQHNGLIGRHEAPFQLNVRLELKRKVKEHVVLVGFDQQEEHYFETRPIEAQHNVESRPTLSVQIWRASVALRRHSCPID